MKRPGLALLLIGLSLCWPSAYAADLPRLVWGDLISDDEAADEPKSWATTESPDGSSVSIVFDRLATQSDGEKDGVDIVFKRHFSIVQPPPLRVQKFNADVRGHITITGNGSARLKVTIGDMERTFEWGSGKPISEDFYHAIMRNTVDGRLPNPFKIGAELSIRRQSNADAVLLTLDSIDISAK